MPIYTVHEPPQKRSERRGPERFRFVRDGFYFWAFLLAPIWMLWHRLWMVLIGYIVVSIALNVALRFAGAPGTAVFFVELLLAILIGLEAGTLRRWTLRRRGWRQVGVVSADDMEAAERRFFDSWGGAETPVRATASPSGPIFSQRRAAAPHSDIVGLFPEPGAPR